MKKPAKKSTVLKRALHPMPNSIKQRLIKVGLWKAYQTRPPYQRNDYIGWISRAKLEETKEKRLQQMLAELKQGEGYMKMKWNPL